MVVCGTYKQGKTPPNAHPDKFITDSCGEERRERVSVSGWRTVCGPPGAKPGALQRHANAAMAGTG